MASRRTPLASNPNVANSPLRAPSATSVLLGQGKPLKRPFANVQREEPQHDYQLSQQNHPNHQNHQNHQPPPSKKQLLDHGGHRPVVTLTSSRPARLVVPAGYSQRTTAATRDRSTATSRTQQYHQQQQQQQQRQQQQQNQQHHQQHHHDSQSSVSVATATSTATAVVPHDIDTELWRKHHWSRFPEMVFYFESIPEDIHAKLLHRIHRLGAKEEKFFSNKVTHLITSRPIPPPVEQVETRQEAEHANHGHQHPVEQPQTINPSLLDLSAEDRRRMMIYLGNRRQQPPVLGHHEYMHSTAASSAAVRRPRPIRNTDVLCKAREMKKKIWSLDKFQKMLNTLFESDACSATNTIRGGDGSRNNSRNNSRVGDVPNISELLQREQFNGPSDRDPAADMRELIHFKGPHVYVYDMDEKQKPIVVREYPRVNVKTDGEWPQFRSVTLGRCPFVEEVDVDVDVAVAVAVSVSVTADHAPAKPRDDSRKPRPRGTDATATLVQPPATTAARATTVSSAKNEAQNRVFAEMKDGSNKPRIGLRSANLHQQHQQDYHQHHQQHYQQHYQQQCQHYQHYHHHHHQLEPSKATGTASRAINSASIPQNAFTGRGPAGRVLAGEPVASGVQPSNVTSAIRSQMVSSTSGTAGTKAGTSKEVHGLQRKVLQKTGLTSRDPSSRRPAEPSLDLSSRPSTLGRTKSRALDTMDDVGPQDRKPSDHVRARSPPQRSQRDLKPGYCENCQEKFPDFDKHLISRKHRRFADNHDNWAELDHLLCGLKRPLKRPAHARSDRDGLC